MDFPFPFLFEKVGKRLGIRPVHEGVFHSLEERKNCEICQKKEKEYIKKLDRDLKRFLEKHKDII